LSLIIFRRELSQIPPTVCVIIILLSSFLLLNMKRLVILK